MKEKAIIKTRRPVYLECPYCGLKTHTETQAKEHAYSCEPRAPHYIRVWKEGVMLPPP